MNKYYGYALYILSMIMLSLGTDLKTVMLGVGGAIFFLLLHIVSIMEKNDEQ